MSCLNFSKTFPFYTTLMNAQHHVLWFSVSSWPFYTKKIFYILRKASDFARKRCSVLFDHLLNASVARGLSLRFFITIHQD